MASICGVNQSMAELFVCLSLYLKLLVWNGVSPYSITVPEFRIWSCFQSQLPSTVLPGRQQFMSPIICPWAEWEERGAEESNHYPISSLCTDYSKNLGVIQQMLCKSLFVSLFLCSSLCHSNKNKV